MNNPGEYTDSMTGLFDKQYFDKWIGEKLYRKESFHLLAVDARNMKQINRIYGTRVGDQPKSYRKSEAGKQYSFRGNLEKQAIAFWQCWTR